MKIEKNKQYFNIGVYVFLTWLAILIVSCLVLNIGAVLQNVKSVLGKVYLLLEPLIIGLVIAYLIDPLVDFYERRCRVRTLSELFHHRRSKVLDPDKKRWSPRTVPTLLAFLTLFVCLGIFVLLVVMNLKQVAGSFSWRDFRQSIEGYLIYFDDMLKNVSKIGQELGLNIEEGGFLSRFYGALNSWFESIYAQLVGGFSNFSLHTMNTVLAFVIAFYLLQDSSKLWAIHERIYAKILGKYFTRVCMIAHQIDQTVSSYIRGELLDSGIIILLTSLALTWIQLDFAIIIGIISGIFNLIPYFGPIVGFILAVVIGLLDPNPIKAVYGAIAILIIQQIDGWIIVPKIVGECVKLHPVVVLIVILIGGNLFGLLGMLLAVPITAIIRILLIFFFPDYFGPDI